jgi:hypothetical protein
MNPGCDGTIERCPYRQEIGSVIREAMNESQQTMQSARCAGHQDLFREVTETRGDIRHLAEKFDDYMARKDKEDDIKSALIEDLRMHGAQISQQNAGDVVLLKERMDKVESHCKGEAAIGKWQSNGIVLWGVILGALLGVLGFALDVWRIVWPGSS